MPDFSLQDENSHPLDLADLRGKIWIADVIFTRCAGQCLLMSAHLAALQKELPPTLPIRFVSFTTDPAFDSPAILKKYAERYNADAARWIFLTGDKSALRHAIVDGLKLAAIDKTVAEQQDANDLFVHSAKFVLIDGAGQIRGYFDGETEASLPEIAAAARRLAKEL
ncbi:MAG TPA: SCO family protein [Verrucomicrobiae bacterium]|nr:SCO family protein [Verrucomicrobiae bacterium]